jgi:methylthioribulose-1-phosphate dehydratase
MIHADAVAALRDVAALFYAKNWSLGTSSNYSVVLEHDPLRLLVTASGKDKRKLKATDFVIVGTDAKPLEPSAEKPSAETWLHVVLAQLPNVGAVLHTHSVWGTVLTDRIAENGFWIEGFEMLKGLAGVTTHEHRHWVEIFPNTQDIPALARDVQARLQGPNPLQNGFLIRRHGLYTWGRDLDEARRQVEIFEFLFEVIAQRR